VQSALDRSRPGDGSPRRDRHDKCGAPALGAWPSTRAVIQDAVVTVPARDSGRPFNVDASLRSRFSIARAELAKRPRGSTFR